MVHLRYNEFPLSVRANCDAWIVELVGKGTRQAIRTKQLIDCIGGADIVGMLGFPRLRERTTQPGTLNSKLVQRRYCQALAKGALKEGATTKLTVISTISWRAAAGMLNIFSGRILPTRKQKPGQTM